MAIDKNGNGTIVKSNHYWCVSNTGTPNMIYIRFGYGTFCYTEVITYEEAEARIKVQATDIKYMREIVEAIKQCVDEYKA